MTPSRTLFLATLLLGLAAAAAFHASGAVSAADARFATAGAGGVAGHALQGGVVLVRLIWAPTGVFQAAHLAAGVLLALAAATSALVAGRLAGGDRATGLAAAVLVGPAMLFGRDVAGLGLLAGPVPVLLALLAGATWAWTSPVPRPALGGFLAGLALACHPLVLFLLPGLGAFALQAAVRSSPDADRGLVRRCAVGFVAGFAAILLPLGGAGAPGPGDALAAWASGRSGPFWAFRSPIAWPAGVVDAGRAAWRNAGPIGLALGLGGLGAIFGGAARLARPFLLVFGGIAAALVLGRAGDHGTAFALAGWSFLFWGVPALARLEERFGPRAAPVASLAAGVALLALGVRSVDHSAEKGVAWAATVLETLPDDAILLTRNPVLGALAADGLRPDVDVVHPDEPGTWVSRRTGAALLPPGEAPAADPGAEFVELLRRGTDGGREVFLDPSLYFDPARRSRILGEQWRAFPHGLAFRLRPRGKDLTSKERDEAAHAWEGLWLTPSSPPSPLRDGLGGSAYFARSLAQSAFLHLEQDHLLDADREFLMALGHPDTNPNVAALGFAQRLFAQPNWPETIRTLQDFVRDDRDGAWLAYRLLGSTLARAGDRAGSRAALQRALDLLPASFPEERDRLQERIRQLEEPGRAPGAERRG